jgi:hypothetical protein
VQARVFLLSRYKEVQWGTNQNVVFEIAMRKLSRLPTLKASRELKNWYFPSKFSAKHYLLVSYMHTKFQGQMIYQKKVIQNLPTLVAVEMFSLLPTLTTFQSLKYFSFAMKFLEKKPLYVSNIW